MLPPLLATGPLAAVLTAAAPAVLALAVATPLAGAAGPATHPPSASSRSTAPGGWVPPVGGMPPAVLHRFAPPPGPYAAGHRGVDLAAPAGDVVRAPAAGRVVFAGSVAGRPVVVLAHPGGLRTTYEPVVPTVAVGEQVGAGQPIGTLAGAGSHCLPRACLHWGARSGTGGTARYLDPLTLLEGGGPVRLLPLDGRRGAGR